MSTKYECQECPDTDANDYVDAAEMVQHLDTAHGIIGTIEDHLGSGAAAVMDPQYVCQACDYTHEADQMTPPSTEAVHCCT